MKKLLILFAFLLSGILANSQDTPPTGTNFKMLPTYSFKYYTINGEVWIYKGSTYGWTKLSSKYVTDSLLSVLKHKNDSITNPGYATNYKLTTYKEKADSILNPGYATNYKLTTYKLKNDSIANSGYFTQYDALGKKDLSDSTDADGYTRRDRLAMSLALKEDKSNKVTSISAGSTDIQYPSAKLLYDQLVLKVPTSRTITTTAPLTIAGTTSADLSADRTLAISAATPSVPGSMSAEDKTKLDGITGFSGTTNYISKFTSATAIGNSQIFDNGTNVGIGTTVPLGKLGIGDQTDMVSTSGITLGGDQSVIEFIASTWAAGYGSKIYVNDANSGNLIFAGRKNSVSWTDFVTINNVAGNVGIGYTDPETYKLKVNGTGYFSNNLTANAFIKIGGTSVQYLLADGSVTTVSGSVYKGQVDGDDGKPVGSGTPLIDGTGTTGWYYACYDAGTYDYGNPSGNSITLAIGDQIYYNGTIWIKIPGAGAYTLPAMTAAALGGAKLGGSLQINADVLNVDSQNFGDIITSNTGETWTINNSVVTLAKMANMNTAKVIGRMTAGTGVPEEIAVSGTGNVAMTTSAAFTTPNIGNATGNISGNAATVTVGANADNATYYPLFSTSATGSLSPKTTAAKLTFNPYTGVLVATNFQLSDSTLKRRIKSITNLSDFSNIKFYQFSFKDDKLNKKHYGASAQEIEKILPELVNTDEKNIKSVNYTELLIGIIARQAEQIKSLEKRIEILENK